MKTTNVMKNLSSWMVVLFSITFLTLPATAQESSSELKLKIVKEKNGERTVIDTTLSLAELEDLENDEELQKLLQEQGIDGLDLDLDGLGEISVDIEELDNDGERDHVMIIKRKNGTNEDDTYDVMVMKSDSLHDKSKMRVMVGGGQYEYIVSEDGEDLTWVGEHRTNVEVIDSEDGKKVVVTREDGSVQEYELPEGSGTYMIGEDGTITKVEGDAVWMDEGSENKHIMITLDEEDGALVITEGDNVVEMKNVNGSGNNVFFFSEDASGENEVFVEVTGDGDGERTVRFERRVIVERIGDKDLETLEKAGADLDTKGKEKLEIDRMKFHPNPSNGQFTLEFSTPETGTTQVDIYNINGEKVYEDTVTNFNGTYKNDIDISGERSGTYFLKIQQGEKVSTRKIVLE